MFDLIQEITIFSTIEKNAFICNIYKSQIKKLIVENYIEVKENKYYF